MCSQQSQHANALITAQDQGTILVMVAWFLACLLALCAAARIVGRFRSYSLRNLALSDDAIVVTASVCALGSTVVVSTAVDSGLGKRQCLLSSTEVEQIQLRVFISTILFVLAVSISKGSIILFLHKVARTSMQRMGVVAVGILVLLWTMAVMAGIVFQCEMPKPWEIWTGKCIPLFPFWVAATAIDIFIDVILILLSVHAVWTLHSESRQRTQAVLLCSLRLLLVAASVVRLFYLQRALSNHADSTFDFVPYAIVTQCHTTLAVMLCCSFMLSPLIDIRHAPHSYYTPPKPKSRHSKHWSGTTIGGPTIGGTPYETYDSFATYYKARSQITKEPLPSIQASMSTPTSPATSRNSLPHHSSDILLPDVPLPTRSARAPPRPPPPTGEQKPDLSIFTKKTVIREPPMVTRLGSVRDLERTAGPKWENIGKERSLRGKRIA